MRPQLLPPNGIARFYRGGPAIAALRGEAPPSDGRVPEDWVGSTTEAFGEPGVGLSRLADGRLLRDAIAAEPEAWLGAPHVARWGADPALLVKLLDAGERLPVHLHPDGSLARARLGARFGKTEAWIVIGGRGPVWLGWREPVPMERLAGWVASRDTAAMLDALHRVDLEVGDALFVPAGVAHAIGAGLLIAELQEPSDMSVLLEWEGIVAEPEATLGLGWDAALACVDRSVTDPEAWRGRAGRLLPEAADPFFRAEEVAGGEVLEAGFAVMVVLEGEGELGGECPLRRGDCAVVPAAAGALSLTGSLRALLCRPPRPDAPQVPAR